MESKECYFYGIINYVFICGMVIEGLLLKQTNMKWFFTHTKYMIIYCYIQNSSLFDHLTTFPHF